MRLAERFRAAVFGDPAALTEEMLPERLAQACVEVLPIQGAGISLVNDEFRVPLGTSDDTATYAERLQFTLGQGPCLHAYAQPAPMRVTGTEIEQRWPLFYNELTKNTPYRSIVSLPLLRVSPGRGGALDVYLNDVDAARTLPLEEATVVTDYVTAALSLARDLDVSAEASGDPGAEASPAWLDAPTARRRMQVWVAIGLATVRLEVTARDALALLRGYAYAHGRVLDDVAPELVSGALPVEALRR